MTIPWLLVAFVGGSVFGATITFAMLMMLLTESPMTIEESGEDSDWKY